jgi:hypothetical protein
VNYSLMNRGYRSDFHGKELFANQDSDLDGEALGDPRVASRR